MIWGLLLLLGVAAAPFVAERFRAPVDETMRAATEGGFAELPMGRVHFRWFGPEDGALAICVHGLTTPSVAWTRAAEELAANGYRVLTYDLYGRGLSDRAPGAQTADFFVAQLNDLLSDQKVKTPFTLLGYSMGGAIAAAYAARFPDRIHKLVLVTPAGMGHRLGALADFVCRTPLVGDWLFLSFYGGQLRRGIAAEQSLPDQNSVIAKQQLAELGKRGFLPAVLSSLRGMLGTSRKADHEVIAARGLPVLAVWGAEDDVIPLAAKEQLSSWNPSAHSLVLKGAGHGLPYTHTKALVAGVITDKP